MTMRTTRTTRSRGRWRRLPPRQRAAWVTPPRPAPLSVEAWLERWLEEEARPTVRPRSYGVYRSIARCHLVPGLGQIPLRELGPEDVRDFLQQQAAAGLTVESIRSHHSMLRRALEIATRYGYTERNVAKLVTPPRLVREEVRPLDRQETQRFLQAAREHRLEALFVLAASTGMRLGELLGLTWRAVDLDAAYVRVERVLARYERDYHLDPPKTPRSRRAIALSPPLVAALGHHGEEWARREAEAAATWQGNRWGLVFTTETGRPLHARTVQENFGRLLEQAGVRRVRFHDLRHGAATLLLEQGVPMKVVQDVLGHAQISMTADLYSHVVPELRRDAAERMREALFA